MYVKSIVLNKILLLVSSFFVVLGAFVIASPVAHAVESDFYVYPFGKPEVLELDELNIPAAPVSRLRSFATPSFATVATSSVPILHSLPGASVKFYLNFVGNANPAWGGTSTPIDTDGDISTFTDAEQALIRDVWARVAEKFAPFNVDVTTQPNTSLVHGQNLEVVITRDYDWAADCLCGGMSYVGSFNINTFLPNISYVFPTALQNNAKYIAEAVAHEIGHQLGLYHQSKYNGTTLVQEYYTGNTYTAPIMGSSYSSARGLWWNGVSDISATSTQDDLAIIGSIQLNGFGYRTQDKGQSTSTATQLPITNNVASTTGIISAITDTDYFSFFTTGGTSTLNVGVASYGPMLRAAMEIRNASNTVVASGAASTTLSQSITANLAAGTYYLVVKSDGTYGDVGQYTVSGILAQAPYTVVVNTADNNGTATTTSTNNYLNGSLTTFTATPNSGYVFSYWSGNLPTTTQAITATSNPLVITTLGNLSLTAHFDPAYQLTIVSNNGTVDASIPSTYAATSGWYASGTPVTLTATPASGYTFASWSGASTSTSQTITLVMDSTKTITANYDAIPVTSGGSSGGGGGGGGGGGSYTPTIVARVTTQSSSDEQQNNLVNQPVVTVTDPGCSSGNVFSTQTGQRCSGQTTSTIVSQPFTPLLNLTQNMQLGSSGLEVTRLQQFLIGLKLLSGQATGYYGSQTSAAVSAFQRANGIEQTGTIGPKTRQKIAQLTSPIAGQNQTTISSNPPGGMQTSSIGLSGPGIQITQNLQVGSRGIQVSTLQSFLITRGFLTGQATGYYGVQTSAAVSAFQRSKGIEQTGTIGPKTRAALSL